jgi:uncharacterized protein YdeI (YjbR/CyaY-like superfamily)
MPRAVYFSSAAAMRAWFEEHATTASELLVGFYKVHTGKATLTWAEAVDEALCVGWIDGIGRRVDDERRTIRFTPRRKGSHWSLRNVARVKALRSAGRMRPAGLAEYEKRSEKKTGRASFEQRPKALPPAHQKTFKANEAAWAFYTSQAPWYQRTTTWWVISAVKPETQARRLATLMAASADGRRMIDASGKVDSTKATAQAR